MGKTSAAVKNRYNDKVYDRINLTTIKGDKEKIKAHAEGRGESVNGFINRAIKETMERDGEPDNIAVETDLTDGEKTIIAEERKKYAEGGFVPPDAIK